MIFARSFFRVTAPAFLMAVTVCLMNICLFSSRARAEELEDSIDAELDAAAINPEPSPKNAKPAPSPKAAAKAAQPDPADVLDTDATAEAKPPQAAPPVSAPAAPAPTNNVAQPNMDLQLDEGDTDEGLKSDLQGPDLSEDLPVEPDEKSAPKKSAPAAPVAKEPTAPAPVAKEPPAAAPAIAPEPTLEPEATSDQADGQKSTPSSSASSTQASSSSGVGDEPDFEFEKRLHKIFYQARPMSDEKWSEMLGPRKEEIYNVQAGDTLWDISLTFFGDGMFWSKLWAENRNIENPHLIAPGKGIHFIAGTESDAPSLSVKEMAVVATNQATPPIHTEGPGVSDMVNIQHSVPDVELDAPYYEDQVQNMGGASTDLDEAAIVARPEIPAPRFPSRPPTPLPHSFRNPQAKKTPEYDSTGLDAPKTRAETESPTVVPNSYLEEGDPKSVGKVEEAEVGDRFAAVGQNVFVKLNRAAKIGDRFSVLYPKLKLTDGLRKLGPVVEIGGTIEINDVVDEAKSYYRALVVFSVNPIRIGSILSEMPLPRIELDGKGIPNDLRVKVLGAEYDETRKLFGENAIVYLDGGSAVGIHENDILAVQTRRKSRFPETKFKDYYRPIGTVKVIKTTPNLATAVVIKSVDDIRVGDFTGGPRPAAEKTIHLEQPEAL